MSELITVAREAAPPSLVLVDLYQQLWSANQTIAESRDAMGEASVEDRVRECEEWLDRPIVIDDISTEQLAGIGRSALETFIDYQKAELTLLRGQSEKDRIEESLTEFTSEHVGKKVAVQTIEGGSEAIILERSGLSVSPTKRLMSGTGRLQRPYDSLSDHSMFELSATEFIRGLCGGIYHVEPIDEESGKPKVRLVIEP